MRFAMTDERLVLLEKTRNEVQDCCQKIVKGSEAYLDGTKKLSKQMFSFIEASRLLDTDEEETYDFEYQSESRLLRLPTEMKYAIIEELGGQMDEQMRESEGPNEVVGRRSIFRILGNVRLVSREMKKLVAPHFYQNLRFNFRRLNLDVMDPKLLQHITVWDALIPSYIYDNSLLCRQFDSLNVVFCLSANITTLRIDFDCKWMNTELWNDTIDIIGPNIVDLALSSPESDTGDEREWLKSLLYFLLKCPNTYTLRLQLFCLPATYEFRLGTAIAALSRLKILHLANLTRISTDDWFSEWEWRESLSELHLTFVYHLMGPIVGLINRHSDSLQVLSLRFIEFVEEDELIMAQENERITRPAPDEVLPFLMPMLHTLNLERPPLYILKLFYGYSGSNLYFMDGRPFDRLEWWFKGLKTLEKMDVWTANPEDFETFCRDRHIEFTGQAGFTEAPDSDTDL